MSLIGSLIGWVLTIFIVVMIVRMILDWTGLLGGGGSPALGRARSLVYAGTEPVIAPVRRVLRPVRAGGIAIDLAFTVVFIGAVILRTIAFAL